MEKISQLGRSLSKNESKKIIGGYYQQSCPSPKRLYDCVVELTDSSCHDVKNVCASGLQDARVECRRGYNNVFNSTCTEKGVIVEP